MSASDATAPPPEVVATVFDVLYVATKYINYIGVLPELTIVLFLFREFARRQSELHTGYFVFLAIGFSVNVVNQIFWLATTVIKPDNNSFLTPTGLLVYWYSRTFFGFWNAALGFNRFVALAYPLHHKQLFSGKWLLAFSLLLVLFPFLADGHSFSNIECRLYTFTTPCATYLPENARNQAIINGVTSVVALLLVGWGVMRMAQHRLPGSKVRIERRLIVHTVVSSALLLAAVVLAALAATHYFGDKQQYFTLNAVANVLFVLHHYLPIAVLFFVSPAFRRRFCACYWRSAVRRVPKQVRIGSIIASDPNFSAVTSKVVTPPEALPASVALK